MKEPGRHASSGENECESNVTSSVSLSKVQHLKMSNIFKAGKINCVRDTHRTKGDLESKRSIPEQRAIVQTFFSLSVPLARSPQHTLSQANLDKHT